MARILWKDFSDCTGCGACAQACGVGAVQMKANEYGFLFPYIDDERCVDCGRCDTVCPIKKNPYTWETEPQCYALRHRSAEIIAKSASGGAFTALLDAIKPDAVFGAAFDADFRVKHICARTSEEVERLRGSKYVQSDTGDSFRAVKELLKDGNRVLYTGTPCQIAGLKGFLGRDHEGLITCDLICEGVQSQRFFDRYLANVQKKRGKVSSVSFRDKSRNGWERSNFTLGFENGGVYTRICQTKDSAYMNSMLFQGGNRDSCYACPFAAVPRQGDFTIGDLWGWRSMTPEWNDNAGISLLVCNSEKARGFLQQLDAVSEMKPVELEQACRQNPNLVRPTHMPSSRSAYMEDLKNMEFDQLEKKWLKPRSLARRLASRLLFWWRNR